MSYLRARGETTSAELSLATGWKKRTIEKELLRLHQEGLVYRVLFRGPRTRGMSRVKWAAAAEHEEPVIRVQQLWKQQGTWERREETSRNSVFDTARFIEEFQDEWNELNDHGK